MPVCSQCGRSKEKECFSKAQRRKKANERKCVECCRDAGSVAPPAAHPAAASQQANATTAVDRPRNNSDSDSDANRSEIPTPISDNLKAAVLSSIRGVVDAIFQDERSRRAEKLPNRLKRREDLESHLMHVFGDDFTGFPPELSQILLQGLCEGGEDINVRLTINDEGDQISLLDLVCRWKQYGEQVAWRGQDEMVELVLATPGLRVNDLLPDQSNALHGAVKYGTAEGVRLLIDAGINVYQRNDRGKTPLVSALEQCHPDMISVLLEHYTPETIRTETVPKWELRKGGSTTIPVGAPVHDSLSDHILRIGLYIQSHTGYPASWLNVGRPLVENVLECLFLLRMAGSSITTCEASTFCFEVMSLVLGNSDKLSSVLEEENRKYLAAFGKALVGFWLPPCAHRQIRLAQDSSTPSTNPKREEPEDCRLCNEKLQKPLSLYCGHSFCRQCILDFGEDENNHFCPVCHSRLCADIHERQKATEHHDGTATTRTKIGSLADHAKMNTDSEFQRLSWSQRIGWEQLSDAQVADEAKADGYFTSQSSSSSSSSLRAELLRKLRGGVDAALLGNPCAFTTRDTTTPTKKIMNLTTTLVLMSNTNMLCGEETQLVAPVGGPTVVEITIAGVPIFAHISNNSRYTLISKSVADTFGLKRMEQLKTNKMRDGLTGNKIKGKHKAFTCIDAFAFQIGKIPVCLRTALEVPPGLESRHGIVLGQDFFLSAALCVVDVNVSQDNLQIHPKVMMRTTGLFSYLLYENVSSTESSSSDDKPPSFSIRDEADNLRYYSYSGETAILPLFHFNPSDQSSPSTTAAAAATNNNGNRGSIEMFLTIDPFPNQSPIISECRWCCRTFPDDGMRHCSICLEDDNVYSHYCNDECQQAAFKIHKARYHQEAEAVD